MSTTSTNEWETKRTEETQSVENVLREAGFQRVDAYRYNSASIRVRVIDSRFEGLPMGQRDALVEPHLTKLPERTQGDIMNLFTFSPAELDEEKDSFRARLQNAEFEHPSPSML